MVKISNDELHKLLSGMLEDLSGKNCCRQAVGRMRSLTIEFGDRIPHGKVNLPDQTHGEWRISTYRSAWRVVQRGKVACASQDVVENLEQLNKQFSAIEFGEILNLQQISPYDIRVTFANDTFVDFLCTFQDDDEVFHVFGPNDLYVAFSVADGWWSGNSNEPDVLT